ncbi:hypothetical protein NF867_07830 [Solitalea sp. MAHUQ-68]|uniref:Uncharacterized protein n=1 Tax=Solitalea agri TaxID=2953739 RepID=A0A9X2F171_9SPHI|nr:hypothetical protein [Solitalea agri]MCO4292767.1 hypothetical protein [Solitalea agri]
MPSKIELEKRFASYSNEQLLDLLNDQEAYTDLAVEVASIELKSRNLSEQEIKDYVVNKYKQAELFIEKNIHEELTLLLKSFFYFCWIPVLTFPFTLNFREDKAILKLRQANFYSTFGFLFFAIGGIVILILKADFLTALSIWIAGMVLALMADKRFNRDPIIRKFEQIIKNYQKSSPALSDKEESV